MYILFVFGILVSIRSLLKVNIDDLSEADDTFSILMGTEVEPRRDFITENAIYADYIDA